MDKIFLEISLEAIIIKNYCNQTLQVTTVTKKRSHRNYSLPQGLHKKYYYAGKVKISSRSKPKGQIYMSGRCIGWNGAIEVVRLD